MAAPILKVNRRVTPQAITNESHTVGEDTANEVWLDELPDPSVAITIAAKTQITGGAPADNQFRCDYETGRLLFNALDNAEAVLVSYTGLGSGLAAHDHNRLNAELQAPTRDMQFGKQAWQAELALTDGVNIAWDLNAKPVARVTLGGNRTLDNPTNMKAGATYTLRVIQDATGGRTLAYGTAYKWVGGAPTIPAGVNAVSLLAFYCDGTAMLGSMRGPFA